jgi:hypothetical protein
MRTLLIVCAILFSTVGLLAQVEVKAELENSQIMIGDQINLHLEASYPAGYTVQPVDLTVLDSILSEPNQKNPDQELAALEVLKQSEWEKLENGSSITYRKDLMLTAWQEGVYFIPPVTFTFSNAGGTINRPTNKLTLLVASPISETAASDTIQIAPIKDIALETWRFSDFLPIIYILAGITALIILVVWMTTYLQKRKQAPLPVPEVIRPAHEIALEKLAALQAAELWQKGEIKQYQSQLTYIIREYIENRYDKPALESTTGEILRDLKEINFPEQLVPKTREMLQLADMVKFAKANPPEETHKRYMGYAQEIVSTTKQIEEEITEEEENKDV